MHEINGVMMQYFHWYNANDGGLWNEARARGYAGLSPSRFQSTRRRALWNTQGQVVVAAGWESV